MCTDILQEMTNQIPSYYFVIYLLVWYGKVRFLLRRSRKPQRCKRCSACCCCCCCLVVYVLLLHCVSKLVTKVLALKQALNVGLQYSYIHQSGAKGWTNCVKYDLLHWLTFLIKKNTYFLDKKLTNLHNLLKVKPLIIKICKNEIWPNLASKQVIFLFNRNVKKCIKSYFTQLVKPLAPDWCI